MSNLAEWYGIECRKCFRHIVLPHRNPLGKSRHPWYWPKDEMQAWFLHPDCGYLSAYWIPEVHLIILEPDQNPLLFPLWRVTIPCEHGNCGIQISVHTRSKSKGGAGASVVEAIHEGCPLNCSKGHVVPEPSRLSIDEVPEIDEN